MSHKPTIMIPGSEKGVRVESRVLEERIQKAVNDGHRHIEIIAQGQHGIGGGRPGGGGGARTPRRP